MKSTIVYALLLVLVISAVISISIEKSERKKSKTKTKDGSGDWAGGYNCPSLEIGIGNGAFVAAGVAQFVAPTIDSPITNGQKHGLAFTFTEGPNSDLKKILVQDNKQWYLPYRFISGAPTYTNPNGNKFIKFSVTNDAKQNFSFKIVLPWKLLGWYISDDEGIKIINSINNKRSIHQSIVSSAKVSANVAASTYMTNKPLLVAATSDKAALDKAKADAQTRLNELEKAITINAKVSKDDLLALIKINSDRLDQENILNTLNQKENSLYTQKSALEAVIKDLGTSSTATGEQKTQLDAKVTLSKTELDAVLNKLKSEAPPRVLEITAAEVATVAIKPEDFSTNLNKVYP